MQLVDSKLYIANMPALDAQTLGAQSFDVPTLGASRRQASGSRRDARTHGNLISLLKATSASARLLALMVAALIVVATPALLATIGSTVSLSFQILLQAGHFGLIAFQIFAR
jgi:hypothetical protein